MDKTKKKKECHLPLGSASPSHRSSRGGDAEAQPGSDEAAQRVCKAPGTRSRVIRRWDGRAAALRHTVIALIKRQERRVGEWGGNISVLPRATRRSAPGELQLTAAQRRCRCSRVLGAESCLGMGDGWPCSWGWTPSPATALAAEGLAQQLPSPNGFSCFHPPPHMQISPNVRSTAPEEEGREISQALYHSIFTWSPWAPMCTSTTDG